MSDFLTLVKSLQRECGVAGSAITTVSGQSGMHGKLVNWIADADIHIQNLRTDWNFLWSQYSASTIAGTSEPIVPNDLSLWDRGSFYLDYSTASNRHLKYLDYKQWRDGLGRGVQTNKKPSHVVIKPGNQIVLVGTPDDAYALTADYWKTPAKMTDNTDESAIPSRFRRIIVVQAKLWYAEEQDMPDVYRAATAELYGDPRERESMGLIDQLKSSQLPNQERRTMSSGPEINIRPE